MVYEYTAIGDHILRIYIDSDGARSWFRKLIGTLPSVSFRSDRSPSIRYDLEVQVKTDCESNQITFERNHRKASLSIQPGQGIKNAMGMLYSAFIIHHQWGLLLKASAVSSGGLTSLYCGPDTGEDTALVKIAADGVFVYDSPFRGYRSGNNEIAPQPLAAIYWLLKADQSRTSLLAKSDANHLLLRATCFSEGSLPLPDKRFALCSELASRVPFYRFEYPYSGSTITGVAESR